MSIWEKKVRQALREGARTTVEIQAHVMASLRFRLLTSYDDMRSLIRGICNRLKAAGEVDYHFRPARGEYVWEPTRMTRAA